MTTKKPTSPKGQKPKTETESISQNLREQIIQIVHDEVNAMLQGQAVPKLQAELPPQPKEKTQGKKGRKVAPGGRRKIASTLDAELERLFREWLKERGLTVSRGLDVVFWHFFDKPKLSFETSPGTDKESDT